ncbi:hypothetical protein BGX33_011766 [Mortierella sp. NVP41]|nr:hypothetical protein BGX33_011766 [Mortierella sp. NVP41]
MTSPLEDFKNIPELVGMVASLLDRKGILSFRNTCRKFHTICQPFYHREARLNDCWVPDDLQALVRHAKCLQALRVNNSTYSLYYQSMFAVLREPATRTVLTSTSSPQSPDTTQLASILTKDVLRALCHKECLAARLYYVLCFSPQLTALSLENIGVDFDGDINFLG